MRETATGVVGATLVLATVAAALAAPAQAAAYRYWTYWQAPSGQWQFATVGPGSSLPPDGAVEGWSFRVSTPEGRAQAAPAPAPDFAGICEGTASVEGRKRVALVIDPGPASIAPDGQNPAAPVSTCVVADEDATGYDVLREVADVRVEGGLVCGIAGYPTGECAPVLDDAEAAALLDGTSTTPSPAAAVDAAQPAAQPAASTDRGSPVATIVIAAALIAGAAAWAMSRRRAGR